MPNHPAGFEELVGRIVGDATLEVRLVLESTGPYSAPLFAFLAEHPARIKTMVVQPKAARDFARACMRRAKTDRVDAQVLSEFARRMEFVPTVKPSREILQLRSLSRHFSELIDRRAAIKNERHAAEASGELSTALQRAMDREEASLGEIIEELESEILSGLRSLAGGQVAIARLTSIPGIKERAVARLLPELFALPRHLTPRECVAYAGLDPKPRQSGTSRAGTSWSISKQGNARIRRSLYLATLTAIRHFEPMRTQYERLCARGKPKKVAIVAAMRKLLTAVWAIFARDQEFSYEKFGTPVASPT